MTDEELQAIEERADAWTFGDTADDIEALIFEVRNLRGKLATVPDYAGYYSEAVRMFAVTGETPMTFDDWLADGDEPDTDTSADGLVLPDDGGDE